MPEMRPVAIEQQDRPPHPVRGLPFQAPHQEIQRIDERCPLRDHLQDPILLLHAAPGAHLAGHIHGMDENALRPPSGISVGQIGEVEEDLLEAAGPLAIQVYRDLITEIRFAGPVDGVEQFEQSLASDLREGIAHGLPDDLSPRTDSPHIQGIREFEDMLRPAQHCDHGGGLHEQVAQVPVFAHLAAGEGSWIPRPIIGRRRAMQRKEALVPLLYRHTTSAPR